MALRLGGGGHIIIIIFFAYICLLRVANAEHRLVRTLEITLFVYSETSVRRTNIFSETKLIYTESYSRETWHFVLQMFNESVVLSHTMNMSDIVGFRRLKKKKKKLSSHVPFYYIPILWLFRFIRLFNTVHINWIYVFVFGWLLTLFICFIVNHLYYNRRGP